MYYHHHHHHHQHDELTALPIVVAALMATCRSLLSWDGRSVVQELLNLRALLSNLVFFYFLWEGGGALDLGTIGFIGCGGPFQGGVSVGDTPA